MTNSAVVVGSVGLDLVADRPGAPYARAAAGNSGSNIAIRLAAAGWDVCFVTLVGDDEAGALVIRDCQRWGVNTAGIVVSSDYATPREFIVSDGSGQSELLFECPGCGALRGEPLRIPDLGDLPPAAIEAAGGAELIIVDLPGAAAAALATESERAMVWYEASLLEASYADQRELGALSQVIKCSSDEGAYYQRLLTSELQRARLKIVTDGENGIRFDARPEGTEKWSAGTVAAVPISPIDTLGAGDAFTAECASRLAKAHDAWSMASVWEAIASGSVAAATACGAVGPRGDMRGIADQELDPWIAEMLPFRCSRCEP